MQIYFHSRLCSYLSRVPILVEGTVFTWHIIYYHSIIFQKKKKTAKIKLKIKPNGSNQMAFLKPKIFCLTNNSQYFNIY